MQSQTSEEKETSSACPKCMKISPRWILEGSGRSHYHHSPPSKGAELPTYLNTPLSMLSSFSLLTSLPNSLPPLPAWHRGTGSGGCSQFITCCLCCSFLLRGGLLTLFLCSSVGSLPWETVLHGLLQCESFPHTTVLHELFQHGSLPQGVVLQEQAAPVWAPMASQVLPANLF